MRISDWSSDVCSSDLIGFDDPRVCGWLHTLGLEGIAGCDALNIFKQIRMVKSESEIALLRIAGRMSEKAINTVIDRLEIGMPLDEIGRIHAVAMAQPGGRSEWIIANIRGLATGGGHPHQRSRERRRGKEGVRTSENGW